MTESIEDFYRSLQLTEDEKSSGAFTSHLGGGSTHWESRGRFQVELLTHVGGLLPTHSLLDIGCGPLRAGVKFIEYLEPGNYCGIDYNADFIQIGERIVSENMRLAARRPTLCCIDNFQMSELGQTFDFALAFSVLNHSTQALRETFFQQLPLVLKPNGRAFITHARWYGESYPLQKMSLRRTLLTPDDIVPGLDLRSWGWEDNVQIFPILDLERLP